MKMSDEETKNEIKEKIKEEINEEINNEEKISDNSPENLWDDAFVASKEIKDSKSKNNMDVSKIEAELETLKASFEVKETQFKRLASDFENFRRRQTQEREDLLKYGSEKIMLDLLPILDNFERALASSKTTTDLNSVVSGLEIIQKQFLSVINRNGVESIEAIDKPFDPNFHEAVQTMPNNEKPDQTVIQELQKGYTLSGRVIRPSMVVISTES